MWGTPNCKSHQQPDKHVEESTQSDKITHLEKTAAMAAACADERAAQLTTALWQCQVDCHKFQDELSEARADLDLSREDVSHMRSALDNARSELRQAENQAALHHSTAVDIERMRAELSELKVRKEKIKRCRSPVDPKHFACRR